MLIQQNVNSIVMLCKFDKNKPDEKPQSFKYIPNLKDTKHIKRLKVKITN